jgi:hypothetical protein
MTCLYRLAGILYRPIGQKIPGGGSTNEVLHPSVMERYQGDPAYRPVNLVRYLDRKG